MCFFSSSVSSLYPSLDITATSKLSPLAESRFIAESIARTSTGTDSLTFIVSFHSDSSTPYASGDPEPVECRVGSKHLDDGLCVSHYSRYRHCNVLVDPVYFLGVFVRHERAHRCPSVCRQHDSVMADDADRRGSL